jgi:hypothetical protein
MRFHQHKFPDHVFLAVALTAGLLALPMYGVFAADSTGVATDPDFYPASGQINPGFDKKLPGASESIKIPTAAQAYAAMTAPVSTDPSLGETASAAPSSASTTGTASPAAAPAAPSGPIGAIGVTMPAKFSQRNETLDRVPIMAVPLPLSDAQLRSIYQAVMADKAPAAGDADKLAPASVLSADQYFNDLHPLPASLRDIGAVSSLGYVKTKDKVLLVEPSTRVVFDEIGS